MSHHRHPYQRQMPIDSYHNRTDNTQWTKEDHRRLLDIIAEKHSPPLTTYQIGKMLGRSKNSVGGYCHRNSIPLPNSNRVVNGCKSRK
jgi:hypothetical protein